MSSLPQQKNLSSPVGFGSLEDYDVNVLDVPHLSSQFQISDLDTCEGVAKPPLFLSCDLWQNRLQNSQDLIVHELSLRLLTPDQSYYDLMVALNFSLSELKAGIKSYEIHECDDCSKSLYFPRPSGGKYNPYIAYGRSRRSALRAYRMLLSILSTCKPEFPQKFPDDFSEKDYNKIELNDFYLFDFVLTFPKDISNKFIAVGKEKELKKIVDMCLSVFIKFLETEFLVQDGDKKELGYVVNKHTWRSYPFDEITGEFLPGDLKHLHLHIKMANWCWNDTIKTFELFRPKLLIPKMVTNKDGSSSIIANLPTSVFEAIKNTWKYIINELMVGLGLNTQTVLSPSNFTGDGNIPGDNPEFKEIETDLFFQIIPFRNRPKIIHGLKYQSRSVVVDIANWCNDNATIEITPELTHSLFEIWDAGGGLTNQSTAYGWWRKAKRCVKQHMENNQDLVDKAIEESGDVYLSAEAEKIRRTLISESFEDYMHIRDNRSRICPFCSGDLEFKGTVDLKQFEKAKILKIELDKQGKIHHVWDNP